jgi:hypothetical protein
VSAVALACLVLAVAMLPSGLVSLRRGAWQARELTPAVRADDLGCLAGIERELRAVEPGAVILADPINAYAVQALAPGWIIADFKTWNGDSGSADIDRRLALLRAMYDSERAERAGNALAELVRRFDATHIVVAEGEVEPPLGSELYPHDAAGLRALLASGRADAERIAEGPGTATRGGRGGAERATSDACTLALWRITGDQAALVSRPHGGAEEVEPS